MRFIVTTLALALLAACATASPSTPATASQSGAAPVQPSRAAQLLAAAGRADAPSQRDIERALGAPDIMRRDGAGAALTYRLQNCALLLLFAADGRNEMRLAEVHPSARTVETPAPSLEQCAAEASARQSS